ncbi:MAG: ABC transporter ATP-binding protein [Treponemataceae bacterium]|nr:ABC transporter ATP-binding protein [Treponemataceae bacterium]
MTDNNDIKIKVNDVYIRFNMATEKVDNIKEYFIRLLKHQLLFQEFMALKGISFEVRAGESWGFIGTNGSGKSTLLKAVSGILKPYKGSVEINGSISPLIELGAGFDGEMTARENIFLNGCVLGYTEKFIREKFDEIVDFAEVRDFLDVPLKNFSSGMAARLGFAIATTVKPDILICDEVLAVGDFKFQEKCEKRMNELLSGGTTLLFVSHDINQVRRMCKKAIWIDHGNIKMIGDSKEVCDAYSSI